MMLDLPKGLIILRNAEIILAGINLYSIRINLPKNNKRLYVIIDLNENMPLNLFLTQFFETL